MPPLPSRQAYPWFRRWIPDRIFYIVPAIMWIVLSIRYRGVTLPTVANPSMEVGGLWGEGKTQGLQLFGHFSHPFLAPYVSFRRSPDQGPDETADAVIASAAAQGISFPMVVKPDRGYQGWGVRAVGSRDDLIQYLRSVAVGTDLILQRKVPFEGEASIFWISEPDAASGRIASMTLTYAPHVIGDGKRTVAALVQRCRVLRRGRDTFRRELQERWRVIPSTGEVVILTNTRSARLGAVYRNAIGCAEPNLEPLFARIAASVPEFHFGRFDVRFRSLDELRRGEAFQIVELNGAGAEMLHIWDGRATLRGAYRDLWGQYRCLFRIADAMRRKGHRPVGFRRMLWMQRLQERLRRGFP
jgi:hypothetical protein